MITYGTIVYTISCFSCLFFFIADNKEIPLLSVSPAQVMSLPSSLPSLCLARSGLKKQICNVPEPTFGS